MSEASGARVESVPRHRPSAPRATAAPGVDQVQGRLAAMSVNEARAAQDAATGGGAPPAPNASATASSSSQAAPTAAAAAATAPAASAGSGPAAAAASPSSSSSTPAAAETRSVTYMAERVIGNGSFGVVFQATVSGTGQIVAIKKVLQDRRFKNRELKIMKVLSHPNVVELKHCFYSYGGTKNDMYLNLVMEFIPETVYRISRQYAKAKQSLPPLYVKLYAYQVCRSLGYLHSLGICHRDIKPQNLLLNSRTHVAKLCDFGSAKMLVRGEPNVAYICSRYYRAPELIFGSTEYTTAIDVWSLGCVIAELLLGQPLFPGDSGVDQLVEIIKVLGTPTRQQIHDMNPHYTEFKFPNIRGCPWHIVFRARTPPEAVDLVSKLLQYCPQNRLTMMETLLHPFFDELFQPDTRLPNGSALPPLFNFTEAEMAASPRICAQLLSKAGLDKPVPWTPGPKLSTSSQGRVRGNGLDTSLPRK